MIPDPPRASDSGESAEIEISNFALSRPGELEDIRPRPNAKPPGKR